MGALSAMVFATFVEKFLDFPISFFGAESDWVQLPESNDFVSKVLASKAYYFPSSMEECDKYSSPNRPIVLTEITCDGAFEGIERALSSNPSGRWLDSFDDVIGQVVTSDADCSSTENEIICYRPLYFAKFRKVHFFAKPHIVADRSFIFKIILNRDTKVVAVTGQWASSFAAPDDFPRVRPVGI